MTTPNPSRQKAARRELDRVFENDANTWAIHYACESLFNRTDDSSPRITAIAVRNLRSGQCNSFSLHHTAEIRGLTKEEIPTNYGEIELQMLTEYFEWLRNNQGVNYLHWNMRNAIYGFQAIEHRFRVLSGNAEMPYTVADNIKTNLASLLINIYGSRYTDDPRMTTILPKNNIRLPGFLNGPEEVSAFHNQNLIAVHTSCVRKVEAICTIANLAHDRTLKTNTTWWQMHGYRTTVVARWILNHPWLSALGTIATIVSAIAAAICN